MQYNRKILCTFLANLMCNRKNFSDITPKLQELFVRPWTYQKERRHWENSAQWTF